MSHVFDDAIAVTALDDGAFRAHAHPAYANMVGPFGGITAATVVHALQSRPDVLGHPLALTLNYAAPIGDGDWELHPSVIRTNRTNQHWVFHLVQNGQTVSTGSAVFGLHRPTWESTESVPPAVPAADEVDAVDFPDFIAWAANYDKRFVTGALAAGPDGKSDDSTSTLWIRDAPERPLDYPSLTSITDNFYPRVFLRHGTYMPAGTITLTTYFHATPDELTAQGDRHVLATVRAARFGNGHFDADGQIWSGTGDDAVLLATTHQLVYFKNPG
ncbi:thioesterase family protein [Gordonia sp. (in: high G+C Gram-positive bacteria)]|uniref:acyl-CoA thioesterase n=1 Tax=Gordonia sp. (in: high G+C Gram-positive bacteria) TaxID=84139 RepID=UPI0026379FA7|nr:thioesterase family protein [Gordonia sp. (in: high G+C Gram-positive bacteria)]